MSKVFNYLFAWLLFMVLMCGVAINLFVHGGLFCIAVGVLIIAIALYVSIRTKCFVNYHKTSSEIEDLNKEDSITDAPVETHIEEYDMTPITESSPVTEEPEEVEHISPHELTEALNKAGELIVDKIIDEELPKIPSAEPEKEEPSKTDEKAEDKPAKKKKSSRSSSNAKKNTKSSKKSANSSKGSNVSSSTKLSKSSKKNSPKKDSKKVEPKKKKNEKKGKNEKA